VYRRRLLLDVSDEFMHETFLGVQCMSGDDKRLTTLVLERGYLTFPQRSARVLVHLPETWRVFHKQRLRWARNTWRSDLRALSRPWVYNHPRLHHRELAVLASFVSSTPGWGCGCPGCW
jgi:hyaluronan synthase